MRLTPRPLSLMAAALAAGTASGRPAGALLRREGSLNESQTVSDPASEWRTYACMAPFTATDNTTLLMLYGGTSSSGSSGGADPLSAATKGSGALQVFDVNSAKWYAPATANAPESIPVLPGCAAAAGSFLVYDPHYGQRDPPAAAAVSLLDGVHWSWSAPTAQGQLPVTRFGAAFAYVADKQTLYMHGGIALSDDANAADSQSGTVNNLDMFSPRDLAWAYASNEPARRYHTLCYMSAIQAAVMFGGADDNVPSYNDVKLLHTATNTWSYPPQIDGDAPAARILHSAVCSEDSMYVFGGQHSTGDAPSDSAVWVLKADNASSLAWSRAPISSGAQGAGPTARAGHSAAIHNGSMYVFGGAGPSGQDSTMYRLDLRSWEWQQTGNSGSSGGEQDGKSRTAVIIAATVSSVLGIVVVGIAATVVYRVVRRRHGGPFLRRARSDTDDSLASTDLGGGMAAADPRDKDPAADRRDSMPHDAGSSTSADAYRHVFAGQPASFLPPPHSPPPGPRPPAHVHEARLAAARGNPATQSTAGPGSGSGSRGDLPDGASAMSTPASLVAGTSPNPADASSGSGSSRRRLTESTRHTSPRWRPTAPGQQPAAEATMYGSDYARTENEYRHAEAINEILLSGQPIPSWLRDAVNQAQTADDSEHLPGPQSPAPSAAAAAASVRLPLSVANDPAPQPPSAG